MEEISANHFEGVLTSTVRMIRNAWNVRACLFIQMDDHGMLRIRASDGVSAPPPAFGFKPNKGLVSSCLETNQILESTAAGWDEGMEAVIASARSQPADKFILVPVAGQTRTLGVLILGPVSDDQNLKAREIELRGAGNLCAVLSAYWRLYEWMNIFIPNINHQLRTPLTAVQGSLGMVLGGVFGDVGSDVKAMLEMAHKGCERTVTAIEEYIIKQGPPDKL